MFLAVVTLCLAAAPWTLEAKIHERMSVEEVTNIFHTTHDSVPEYEVVQFHMPRLRKRSSSTELEALQAVAFGGNLKLWLRPTEGFLAGRNTPVYLATKNPRTSDVIYNEVPGAMENLGELLEDPTAKATLFTKINSKGQYTFNGIIQSEQLIVKPVPERISNYISQNNFTHDSSKSSKSAHHFVYKRRASDPLSNGFPAHDVQVGEIEKLTAWYTLPDVVYPEVMVVVDHGITKMLLYEVDSVLTYLLAFWNGVDLLYRGLKEPKFRFNIARIAIGMEDQALPYLANNAYGPKTIHAFNALDAAQSHFYSKNNIFPVDSYDLIAVITDREMVDKEGHSGVLGIAQTKGACAVHHQARKVKNVAITQDDGSFDGIATAAHEIAHLFGSTHDTQDHCKPTDGYIMAPKSGVTENSHDFSECTINAIAAFLRERRGLCLYNEPIVKNPLPRDSLPGQLTSRNEHCAKLGHTGSCYKPQSGHVPCAAIYCYDQKWPNSCVKSIYHAPPDGAFCDHGKICLHGQCVVLNIS